MEKRGLCSACVFDKECSFPRKYPIWECGEFSIFLPAGNRGMKKRAKPFAKARV